LIAIDTNILVYADREETPLHGLALAALRRLSEGPEAWALPIFSVAEFLRVVSHPRVFNPPTPVAEALSSIESLLRSPSARVLVPGPAFLGLLRAQLQESGATGNLVYDAQIAAVCLEHGARSLLSEDRDFARFPRLQRIGLAAF
jgi:toxin-antitoxin system PIN domain toxin